ncbi:MAG: hypothetical protein NVS2B7_19540 [Herpetosiphon sp.]
MKTNGSFTVRRATPAVPSTRQRRWVAVQQSLTLLMVVTALLMLAVTVFLGSASPQASQPLSMSSPPSPVSQATGSSTLPALSQAQFMERVRTTSVAIPAADQTAYILTLPPQIQTQFARQARWGSAADAANEAFIRALPVEMQEQIRRFLAGTSN